MILATISRKLIVKKGYKWLLPKIRDNTSSKDDLEV